MLKSADDLFRILILDYAKYQEKDALKGVRSNKMYTILESKFNDVCTDDNGAYKNSRRTKKVYHLNIDRSRNAITSQGVHEHEGDFYCNVRGKGNTYDRVLVDKREVWTLERYYRVNKSIPGLKRTIVRVKAFDSPKHEPHLCVVYSMEKDESSTVEIQSHGNSKRLDRPYIRTSNSTLSKEKELLSKDPGKNKVKSFCTLIFLVIKMRY